MLDPNHHSELEKTLLKENKGVVGFWRGNPPEHCQLPRVTMMATHGGSEEPDPFSVVTRVAGAGRDGTTHLPAYRDQGIQIPGLGHTTVLPPKQPPGVTYSVFGKDPRPGTVMFASKAGGISAGHVILGSFSGVGRGMSDPPHEGAVGRIASASLSPEVYLTAPSFLPLGIVEEGDALDVQEVGEDEEVVLTLTAPPPNQ